MFAAVVGVAQSRCTVGPDFVRPDKPDVKQYIHGEEPEASASADGQVQRFESGVPVPEKWWEMFESSKLDPLVSQALKANFSLEAAQASLRQSQDNLRAGYGVYYPQFNAGFDASREKATPISFGVNAPSTIFNLFTLCGTISYVLDVFGGERRMVEGLRAQTDQQRNVVLATYLTLTGNIVNTVIARAAYQAEIEATREVILSEKDQVLLTAAQVEAGTVPYSNLLSLQSQLAATEATLPPLSQRLDQSDHLLATLAGQTPASFEPLRIRLDELSLPKNLPKTLPSELARQRPDILQSEAQLHVASAQIGVTTAALYPSFTLNGTLGVLNSSLGSIFSGKSSFWSYGGGVTAPIFHGGTLRAQRQAAIDAYQAAAANYRQTVLSALSQVADTLRALEHDAELVAAQSQALGAAKQARELILANYKAGTVGYLQLLAANAQYSQAKVAHLQGVAQRFQDTVALFVALGGGGWSGGPHAE